MSSLTDEMKHTNEIEKQPEAHLREYGMDIAVVDDGDANGWLSPATGVCEIYMSDVKSMVANVLRQKGPYQIRRLDIIDHGNDHSFLIGDDWISPDTLEKFRPELSKLKGHFSAGGFVHLQNCDIGMNGELLVALARMWGVSVYAGTGDHRSDIRYQSGRYVRADPNGSVRPAGRPDEDSYQSYSGMREGESVIPAVSQGQRMKSSSTAKESPPPPEPEAKVKLIK